MFNFWLHSTLLLSPYLPPTLLFILDSIFHPQHHHPNSLQHIAFDHHVQPRCPYIHIRDPMDLEMDDHTKQTRSHPQIECWFNHSGLLASACPSSAPSHGSQPTPWYPLWFPGFLHLHPIILHCSQSKTDPAIALLVLTPKTISLRRDITRVRRGNDALSG